MGFKLETPFEPCGDQPQAIEHLVGSVNSGKKASVLLGITGSGKTFTMANVIAQTQKPTLVLAHNKTLAAQLYQEFQGFFPHNAVEYFVSYYDYYQPEAYIPRTDTYIEKDMSINDRIDRLRLSATRALLERKDVLIVASVSCIYGLGMPEYFASMRMVLAVGESPRRDDFLLHLVEMQYKRSDYEFARGNFRVRGDVVEIFPAYEEDVALRIEFFGDEIERISEVDPLTGTIRRRLDEVSIYPSSHHVTPAEVREQAVQTIREELKERLSYFKSENLLVEEQRIGERTRHDLEMIKEIGFCKGIENYSRHFGQREAGSPPPCLLDYFPDDFLIVVDESHQTLPQVRAMQRGDAARKRSLVDFGFRLPSAYDNRPLSWEEFLTKVNQAVYVSATPAEWEIDAAEGEVVEQIIRPTGLLDPEVEVRPAAGQVDDCLDEIRQHTSTGGRVLVTTLTKKLAEDLTSYLGELNVRAKYLHSDIDTIERVEIIRDLRMGKFDVLVGINLLREGLDIPEVSLVAILDADKEGFLRSATALIQTCGRAARNAEGRVIMYADKETDSIQKTLKITQERRRIQEEHNKKHGITPKTIVRSLGPEMPSKEEPLYESFEEHEAELMVAEDGESYLSLKELRSKIKGLEKEMKRAAKELCFEEAAELRDEIRRLQEVELSLS